MMNKQTKQITSFSFRIQNSSHFYSPFKFLLTWIIGNIFSLKKKIKMLLIQTHLIVFSPATLYTHCHVMLGTIPFG